MPDSFLQILLYGILEVLVKAVPQIFCHKFSLFIDRNAGSFIPVFLVLQQEELFAADLRFVYHIPCANVTLDRDVVGIAVEQTIVFLFLLFHKFPDSQQSTRKVQTFFAQFQPTVCTKVKFLCGSVFSIDASALRIRWILPAGSLPSSIV